MADTEETTLNLHIGSGVPGEDSGLGMPGAPSTQDLERAAEVMALGQRPLAVRNYTVYGMMADGELEPWAGAKAQIRSLKGHAADGQRPYGLTIPHHRFAGLIDTSRVAEPLKDLVVRNPTEFVERLGAIAFLRVPADEAALEREGVPACAISTDEHGQKWIQNYDPAGGMLSGLTGAASALEVRYPVITSLNRGGEPEIVDPEAAEAVISHAGMAYLADPFAERKVQGSYPIVQCDAEGLRLVREGCFGNSVMRALLAGHELQIPDDMLRAKYPPLEVDQVPELAGLEGAELRQALLAHVGWDGDAPLRLEFREAQPSL